MRDFLSKPCLMTPEGKLKSSWFHAATASFSLNRPSTWVEILSHRRSKQIPTYKLMSFTWPSSRSACLPNQISSIIPVCAEHQIIYIYIANLTQLYNMFFVFNEASGCDPFICKVHLQLAQLGEQQRSTSRKRSTFGGLMVVSLP